VAVGVVQMILVPVEVALEVSVPELACQ